MRISDAVLCKRKSLPQFVLFELGFNNVEIIPNEHGLPERKKYPADR